MEKLKSTEFEQKLNTSEFVLIDFSAPGCAPCLKIPPLISRLLEELNELNISAFEVNVAEEPEIAKKYFVMGVPTLVIFKKGQEIKRFNSVPKIEKIMKFLKQ
ncbi:MAG: thioredoxin family protein [Candidatus Aminicenantes bacterium]|nr:thioredoxin family protein [Candidatus Aminicenantes bacterium]